jgi:hypothetical protein
MKSFLAVYERKHTESFFKWLDSIVLHQETIDNFCEYHTEEKLKSWLDIFPPPSLCESWERWNKLGRPLK